MKSEVQTRGIEFLQDLQIWAKIISSNVIGNRHKAYVILKSDINGLNNCNALHFIKYIIL